MSGAWLDRGDSQANIAAASSSAEADHRLAPPEAEERPHQRLWQSGRCSHSKTLEEQHLPLDSTSLGAAPQSHEHGDGAELAELVRGQVKLILELLVSCHFLYTFYYLMQVWHFSSN